MTLGWGVSKQLELHTSEMESNFGMDTFESVEIEKKMLTPKQLKKRESEREIVAKKQQQRQKFLHRHFFSIIRTSVKLGDIDKSPIVKELWKQASVRNPKEAEEQYQLFIDYLVSQFTHPIQVARTKETLDYGLGVWLGYSDDPASVPAPMLPLLALWRNKPDRQIHVLNTCEVLDFLYQKMQRPILNQLLEHAAYNWIIFNALSLQGVADMDIYLRIAHKFVNIESGKDWIIRSTRELTDFKINKWEAVYPYIYDDLVQSLSFINWAREFEKVTTPTATLLAV
jgi:hypothetical protein